MAANTLVLYDHPVSSNALKVRFALATLALRYERVHVPLAWPRPDEYTQTNPFSRIPTLVDDGLVLPESNAILRYLADREERDDLYPRDPRKRAVVDRALDAWATLVRPALFPAENLGLMQTGDWEEGSGRWEDAADQDALKAAVADAHAMLARWEAIIADNGTVTGTFTIAECCVGPVLWRWLRLPLDLSDLPRTAAMQRAIANHPAFAGAQPVA